MTAIDPGRREGAAGPATPVVPDLGDAVSRLTTVKVNLLPAEITVARKGQKVRRVAVAAVALLALVLAGLAFVARADVGSARSDLAAADALSASLRSQQVRYADVVRLQDQVRQATQRLGALTAGELDWAPLFEALADAIPAGVTLAEITAATEDSGAAGSVGGAPGGTGTTPAAGAAPVPVGTLTLTGNASDPDAVAAFVDALSTVRGLSDVVATGVSAVTGSETSSIAYTYGISAVLTSAGALPVPTGAK